MDSRSIQLSILVGTRSRDSRVRVDHERASLGLTPARLGVNPVEISALTPWKIRG